VLAGKGTIANWLSLGPWFDDSSAVDNFHRSSSQIKNWHLCTTLVFYTFAKFSSRNHRKKKVLIEEGPNELFFVSCSR
jgi:hypothetical protein